jgi:hypothetical protein
MSTSAPSKSWRRKAVIPTEAWTKLRIDKHCDEMQLVSSVCVSRSPILSAVLRWFKRDYRSIPLCCGRFCSPVSSWRLLQEHNVPRLRLRSHMERQLRLYRLRPERRLPILLREHRMLAHFAIFGSELNLSLRSLSRLVEKQQWEDQQQCQLTVVS